MDWIETVSGCALHFRGGANAGVLGCLQGVVSVLSQHMGELEARGGLARMTQDDAVQFLNRLQTATQVRV